MNGDPLVHHRVFELQVGSQATCELAATLARAVRADMTTDSRGAARSSPDLRASSTPAPRRRSWPWSGPRRSCS
eukprot:3601530-Pyramimonas_sp.AAC.1